MERAPAGESARRWRESERGARSSGGVTGRRTEPPARGRPQVATLEDQGQLSRKGAVRTSRPRARHPPPFLPLTFIVSPGVQTRLEHSPTLLSPWARRQDFWAPAHRPPSLPGAWRLGRQDVQYYTFLEVERF